MRAFIIEDDHFVSQAIAETPKEPIAELAAVRRVLPKRAEA